MNRRILALALTVLAFGGIVMATRTAAEEPIVEFAAIREPWMPAVSMPGGLTGSWFCPGVPADGDDVGGDLLIANTTDVELTGVVRLFNEDGANFLEPVSVAPWASLEYDVDEALGGPFVSALVELDGGGGKVEQRADHPEGQVSTPCANAASESWYFADGYTVGGSLNQIVLTNPYDDAAIVDLGFATKDGSRSPGPYQGFPIPPRSVRVVDLGAPGAGAQGEETLAIKIESSRGRVVAGRSQVFREGRAGFTMTLGSPALRDQWWFSEGLKGSGVIERFSLYNPTDDDVAVDALYLGLDTAIGDVDPLVVPARQVITLETGADTLLPEGRHTTVFRASEPAIVVERALTVIEDGRPSTSVTPGATPRTDGFVASTWYTGAAPTEPTTDALVIYNVDTGVTTATIYAVTADGPTPIPGMEAVDIAPAAIATIDLTDDVVLGRDVIVAATGRLFIERSVPTGNGASRYRTWGLPAI